MKRTIKLLISSVLALIIVFSFNGTANAETLKSDQSNLVSIEDYEDAMSKIYAEYGIGWKITDSSNSVSITREIYESEIKRAYEECKEYQAQLSKSKLTNLYTMNEKESTTNYSLQSIMPVTKYISADYTVKAVSYRCTFRALAKITYNADTGYLMNVISKEISSASGINFDSWMDTGSSISISGKTGYARFKGTAFFSYRLPGINVKVSKSIPFDAGRPMK